MEHQKNTLTESARNPKYSQAGHRSSCAKISKFSPWINRAKEVEGKENMPFQVNRCRRRIIERKRRLGRAKIRRERERTIAIQWKHGHGSWQ